MRMRERCVHVAIHISVCVGEERKTPGTRAMPTSRKKMALLHGLDQYSAYYSVICVFGSVVGCVVVPLITQVRSCSPFATFAASLLE